MRQTRSILLALLLAVGAAGTAQAQARADQARLTFGIGLGFSGATDLWRVDGQTLLDDGLVDTASFARSVRPSLGITFLGTYYPGQHWGFVGSIHLLGLAFEDACLMQTSSGSGNNVEICEDIDGATSPGTTVTTTLGMLYRPLPWSEIQPYLRVDAGLVLSQLSTVRMRGSFTQPLPPPDSVVDYFVFQDDHPASVHPALALGAGLTAFLSRSYQVRLEGKDNIVWLEEVAGTVPVPNAHPATVVEPHHVFSLTIALEVVLERRRGRRY
jgi:hypothetical protein